MWTVLNCTSNVSRTVPLCAYTGVHSDGSATSISSMQMPSRRSQSLKPDHKGSDKVKERQWQGSGKAVRRQWKGSSKVKERQWQGSGKAVARQ